MMQELGKLLSIQFPSFLWVNSHLKNIIWTLSCVNSQVSKKLTPQVSSWFSTTKGIDCEEMTHDQADLTISGYSLYFPTLDARLKKVFPVVISGLQLF